MPSFQRNRPSSSRSFAFRTFNSYETEINEHFWSFKVISEYAGFEARTAKRQDPLTPAATTFHASGPDARRIPPTVSDWLDAQVELENWLRLSALVSAAAFHEAYLRQVVRTALIAAPMARYGNKDIIDGAVLLKNNVEVPFENEVMSVTRGDWQSRALAFRRLFGGPEDLFPIAELEQVRTIRNDYAHGFGRDLDIPDPTTYKIAPSHRLRQTAFTTLIGVISQCARNVDRYLLHHVIGDFEFLFAYHKWTGMPGSNLVNPPETLRQFQSHIHGTLEVSRSKTYCKELIQYFNNIPVI